MESRDLRAERRVALSRRATLLAGNASFPCLLQDASSTGFFIISNQRHFVGQVLELKCEIYPERFLSCKIEIRHISDTCMGTRIAEISPAGTALLQQILQEYYSLKLNQST